MPKNSFIILIVIVAIIAILVSVFSPGGEDNGPEEISLTDLITKIKEGEITELEVKGETVKGISMIGPEAETEYKSRIGENTNLEEVLKGEGVAISGDNAIKINYKEDGGGLGGTWTMILINFLPLILFGALLIFLLRRAQGGANQAMGFARSKAKMFSGDMPTVTFADVAGAEEAKEGLQEIVEFLKHGDKFLSLGARIPRGVLLVGPPGTGKTLLSRAVAGEAGVPFFSISGSEFVEMFVGVGAARVRDLFDQAKRNAPCLVFIDEIDAVGRHRGAGLGGGHDEREQTLNQILSEMDGFETNANVIVLAATNRPDILDPALLRPGRFDRRVILDQPDIKGRKAILEVHVKGKPLNSTADLEVIAKQTPGFSGADLANLINEAAILAARRNKKEITMEELEESIDRVQLGPERKSRVISDKEKRIVAYHETGHALVARMLPNADPVHKISIIARGLAGGYTKQLPTEDRYLTSRSQFEDILATMLGGHVAEELIFGDITTGASNDLERATQIARTMIMRYGMSDRAEYEQIPISAAMEEARKGNVEYFEVYGNDILLKTRDGQVFQSRKEEDMSLLSLLQEYQIDTESSGIKVFIKESQGLNGLGLRVYGKRQEMVFLGKEISEERDYGDKIADEIDGAVHRIIQNAYNVAKNILTENHDKLVQVAERLIVEETIEGEALNRLFDSEVPDLSSEPVSQEPPPSRESKPQAPEEKGKNLPEGFSGESPPEPLGNV
ncbi:MAG: ATP-dependent zinc metalloprotease FtsH [Dehalococcoidia bacterium]